MSKGSFAPLPQTSPRLQAEPTDSESDEEKRSSASISSSSPPFAETASPQSQPIDINESEPELDLDQHRTRSTKSHQRRSLPTQGTRHFIVDSRSSTSSSPATSTSSPSSSPVVCPMSSFSSKSSRSSSRRSPRYASPTESTAISATAKSADLSIVRSDEVPTVDEINRSSESQIDHTMQQSSRGGIDYSTAVKCCVRDDEFNSQSPPTSPPPTPPPASRFEVSDTPVSYEDAIVALQETRAQLRLAQIRLGQHQERSHFHSPQSHPPPASEGDIELMSASELNEYGGESRHFTSRRKTFGPTSQSWPGLFFCCTGSDGEAYHVGSDGSSSTTNEKGSFDEYFNMPFSGVLKKRLPWLIGLLILQSFSASILHAFDTFLQDHIVISLFLPMLVGTGGNAGNQPGVMVTRGLATGSLEIKRLLWREFKLGLVTASTLGFITFVRVLVEYPGDSKSALAVSMALFAGVMISVFMGIGFSLGLDKMQRCDPADGAAPLLTTISDLLGITLLCAISYLVLA